MGSGGKLRRDESVANGSEGKQRDGDVKMRVAVKVASGSQTAGPSAGDVQAVAKGLAREVRRLFTATTFTLTNLGTHYQSHNQSSNVSPAQGVIFKCVLTRKH